LDITFSVNLHDSDGDVYDECLLLHIGDTAIIRLERDGLPQFIKQLKRIDKEIKELPMENY